MCKGGLAAKSSFCRYDFLMRSRAKCRLRKNLHTSLSFIMSIYLVLAGSGFVLPHYSWIGPSLFTPDLLKYDTSSSLALRSSSRSSSTPTHPSSPPSATPSYNSSPTRMPSAVAWRGRWARPTKRSAAAICILGICRGATQKLFFPSSAGHAEKHSLRGGDAAKSGMSLIMAWCMRLCSSSL